MLSALGLIFGTALIWWTVGLVIQDEVRREVKRQNHRRLP